MGNILQWPHHLILVTDKWNKSQTCTQTFFWVLDIFRIDFKIDAGISVWILCLNKLLSKIRYKVWRLNQCMYYFEIY